MALAIAVAAAAVVWAPLLDNYFFNDDFLLLQGIVNLPLAPLLLQPAAGHLLVVRNLVAVASFHAFGVEPTGWFAVVLATHLVNVGLLVVFLRRLTGSAPLACFGGVLWGVCPTHDGTLGWYIVYAQALATTFLLIGLVRLAGYARSDARVPGREVAAWMVLLLLASTTFGTGIGAALVFPAVAFLLLPATRYTRAARRAVLALPLLVGAVYLGAHLLYARWYLPGTERSPGLLLSLLVDWTRPVLMLGHLLAAGTAATVGSFAVPLSSYPGEVPTALVTVVAGGVAAVLVAGPADVRRRLLAVLVLACGVYGSIAAGRGPLYAALVPPLPGHGAELNRYHYPGQLCVAVAVCLLLARLGAALPPVRRLRTGLLAIALVALAGLRIWSGWRIDHHDVDRRKTLEVVRAIEDARATASPARPVYLPNRRFAPAVVDALFAGWAAVYTIFVPEDPARPVFFVEPRPARLALAPPGSPLARVLVPPAESAGGGAARTAERAAPP